MERQEMASRRIYRRIEAMQIEIALLRIGLAFRAFNPNQPRVPAGHPDGGQWTSDEGTGMYLGDDDARLIFVSDTDNRYKVDLKVEEGRRGTHAREACRKNR